MKIYYYYHIPKTGGSSIKFFFNILNNKIPNSKIYDFYNDNKVEHQIINLEEILSLENIEKYDYIFIHHHHGYYGLMKYENILNKKKKELKEKGHTIKIFTTIRDILSFNNSRINFSNKLGFNSQKHKYLKNENNLNIQSKYFFFGLPRNKISSEEMKEKLTKTNILKISDVVDFFVETKNVTKFIDIMCNYFNVKYNLKIKKNTTKHEIIFDDIQEKLFSLNELDCFLFKKYKNQDNVEFNL